MPVTITNNNSIVGISCSKYMGSALLIPDADYSDTVSRVSVLTVEDTAGQLRTYTKMGGSFQLLVADLVDVALDPPPEGFVYLTDASGAYIISQVGSYLITRAN